VENNTKCEKFLGEMCLEKETYIIHLKGLFAMMNVWRNKIEPLESPREKPLEKQLKKNLSKVELLWQKCLAKQKNPQVSQSKTPFSTLDTLDVFGMKDKNNI
jgi:hypothetical protein